MRVGLTKAKKSDVRLPSVPIAKFKVEQIMANRNLCT
jgi:hypothetical protein